ncbi:MAG: DUF393 domain-containing protein [Bdellovibrionales bacterium]|nr:DUF393 domain-containing protein [Bdellovibrionales bacterium]
MKREDEKQTGASPGGDDQTPDTAYYDGDCPMCSTFVARLGTDTAVDYRDLRTDALPDTIARDEAERLIHVQTREGSTLKGAQAVLHLLERHGRWRWLARFGRLPVIRSLADVVYAFIAANRFYIFGPMQRLYWMKQTLVIATLIPLWITRNLWFGETSRFYALTPVVDWLPAINWPLDHVIFGVMAALLLAAFFSSRPRNYIVAFLAVAVPYSCWDQSRWMPYNFQFAAMFLALALVPWEPRPQSATQNQRVSSLAMLSVVIFSIWFWSGLHKVSMRYLTIGFPWLISPFTPYLPEAVLPVVPVFGLLSTPVEAGGALLLLSRRTRALGVLLVTSMHCFILLVFGPFGHSFNHSVWSWNVAMIAFCWLCFWRNSAMGWRDVLWGRGAVHKLTTVIFLVMPILNYAGMWDDFLSHKLYTWTTKEAEIDILDESIIPVLPPEMRPWVERVDGRSFVHVLKWSYSVFESPPYHADRVFDSVFAKVCETVPSRDAVQLRLFHSPNLTGTRSRIEVKSCPSEP